MNTDHGPELQETVEMHHQVDLTEEDFTLESSDCNCLSLPEVETPLWTLLDQVVVSQPGQAGEPARAIEIGLEPV